MNKRAYVYNIVVDGVDPNLRARQSESQKVVWLRPEYRKKLAGGKWTLEKRAALSAKRKAQWADPEFRAKMEATHATPEFHEKQSRALRLAWAARRKSTGG